MSEESQQFDSNFKVLIIDDLGSARKILAKLLNQIGINNIEEAKNGQEGLDKVLNSDFNLIISDWEMPVMTGLQLLKNVRSNDKTSKIPFIMITSHNKREVVIEAAEAGISDFMSKPFTPELLQSKIGNALKKPVLVTKEL